MNNVFEQKKNWRKKISVPAWPGPAGPPGSPKVVKIVPLGSLTLLKRSGTLKVHEKNGVVRPVTPPLAKVMPKTRFWPVVGVFDPFLGPAGAETL